MSPSHWRTVLTWTIAAGAACSNATGPGAATHPVGLVAGTPLVASRPFAVAISANGVAYVGRQDVPYLQATTLPDSSFSDSVRVGVDPTDIAFNKVGTTAYVTNQFSGTVGIVSVAAGVSVDSVGVPGSPFRVLAAPNTGQVFVSSNNDSVYAIALSSKTIVRRWGFNAPVNGMVLTGDGVTLYVSSIGGSLYRFNVNGSGSVDSAMIGGKPQDVALAPGGQELYVANETGSLEIRNPTSLARIDTVAGATGAFGLKPTPDGAQLYATYPGLGLIRIIDVGSRTLGPTLVVGGTPRRIAFDRTGGTALIPNEAGFVTVIR
jgi:DNA-binding beta-propeller fold protein YncE